MKKYLLLIILSLCCLAFFGCEESEPSETNYYLNLFSDGLASATMYTDDGKKYGYFNEDFEVAISFIYDDARGFNNGLAVVKQNDLYYLIDTNGHRVGERYDYLKYYPDYQIYIGSNNDGEDFLISSTGEVLGNYKSIQRFDSSGLSVVEIGFGNYGIINLNGELLISNCRSIEGFYRGYGIIVDENMNCWTIDTNLNKLHNFEQGVVDLWNGCVKVENKIMDVYGNVIVEDANYNASSYFEKYYYYLSDGYVRSLYTYDGKVEITDIKSFEQFDNYFLIFKNHTLYVYDKDFKILEDIKFSEDVVRFNLVEDYYRNRVYVQLYSIETEKYINYLFDIESGSLESVDFLNKYDDLVDVYKDYLAVELDEEYGLITLSGKVIFKPDKDIKYIATDDGYFVNNREQVIYDENKKELFRFDDWYSVNFNFPY